MAHVEMYGFGISNNSSSSSKVQKGDIFIELYQISIQSTCNSWFYYSQYCVIS